MIILLILDINSCNLYRWSVRINCHTNATVRSRRSFICPLWSFTDQFIAICFQLKKYFAIRNMMCIWPFCTTQMASSSISSHFSTITYDAIVLVRHSFTALWILMGFKFKTNWITKAINLKWITQENQCTVEMPLTNRAKRWSFDWR